MTELDHIQSHLYVENSKAVSETSSGARSQEKLISDDPHCHSICDYNQGDTGKDEGKNRHTPKHQEPLINNHDGPSVPKLDLHRNSVYHRLLEMNPSTDENKQQVDTELSNINKSERKPLSDSSADSYQVVDPTKNSVTIYDDVMVPKGIGKADTQKVRTFLCLPT